MMMMLATLFSETHFLSSGFETPPKGLKGYRGGSGTLVPNSLLLLIIIIINTIRNHFEILKMLLDRGATIPVPHDVKVVLGW